MAEGLKIAVVGATGLVGGVMLRVLEERGFASATVIAAASERSVGRQIAFGGRTLTVESVEDAIAANPDYAIFSAGAAASRRYAPLFAEKGTVVIDNSSAWRMDNAVPLVVPEINIQAVPDGCRLIANPNCSTIQMVLALSGLHRRYGIRRIVVSTYQSVSGSGQRALNQLFIEERGDACPREQMFYPHPIHRNVLPHGGDFRDDGYTTEEQKLVDETRKILGDASIAVSATVARVPVVGGHSESVNVEFKEEYDIEDVRRILSDTEGVVVIDDPSQNQYPMPILSQGRDEVFVGRIRRDPSQPRTLNMWVVADNLRKGAATNAVQIMQRLLERAL